MRKLILTITILLLAVAAFSQTVYQYKSEAATVKVFDQSLGDYRNKTEAIIVNQLYLSPTTVKVYNTKADKWLRATIDPSTDQKQEFTDNSSMHMYTGTIDGSEESIVAIFLFDADGELEAFAVGDEDMSTVIYYSDLTFIKKIE